MSEKNTPKAPQLATDRRPVRLARRDDAAAKAMLTRALGDTLPQLDVSAFNSAI